MSRLFEQAISNRPGSKQALQQILQFPAAQAAESRFDRIYLVGHGGTSLIRVLVARRWAE